MNFRGILNPN